MSEINSPEVKRRIEECNVEVLGEVYTFAQELLDEVLERVYRIETKAASTFGYSITIIALVASSFGLWMPALDKFGKSMMPIAVIFLMAAAIFSARATAIQTFLGFSLNDLLREPCIGKLVEMQKYRILTIVGVIESHESASKAKSANVRRAQKFLSVAGGCFIVAIADATFRVFAI